MKLRLTIAYLLSAIGLISLFAGVISGIIGDNASLLISGIMAVVCLGVSCIVFGDAEINNK